MLRGVLPTYITDSEIVLSKRAPFIRNTYEVRLALFMAAKQERPFLLVVPDGATLADGLEEHLVQHGGTVRRVDMPDYSVYFGCEHGDGAEGDGWVLGDNKHLESVHNEIRSPWLRAVLNVGSTIRGTDLGRLRRELGEESFQFSNIDEEQVIPALLALVDEAELSRG